MGFRLRKRKVIFINRGQIKKGHKAMFVSGVELFPIDITALEDKDPVYIEFVNEGVFTSQWGIVDQKRKVTIHKDFTLSFNNKCKYYGLHEEEKKGTNKGIIVQF